MAKAGTKAALKEEIQRLRETGRPRPESTPHAITARAEVAATILHVMGHSDVGEYGRNILRGAAWGEVQEIITMARELDGVRIVWSSPVAERKPQ